MSILAGLCSLAFLIGTVSALALGYSVARALACGLFLAGPFALIYGFLEWRSIGSDVRKDAKWLIPLVLVLSKVSEYVASWLTRTHSHDLDSRLATAGWSALVMIVSVFVAFVIRDRWLA